MIYGVAHLHMLIAYDEELPVGVNDRNVEGIKGSERIICN